MSPSRRTSLRDRYPKRWDVPLFIAGATALLVTGLSLPLMNVQKMVFFLAGAIAASMLVTVYVDRLACRDQR